MDAIERGKRLEEILAEKGMSMGLAYGSDDLQQSEEIVDRLSWKKQNVQNT